VAGSTAQNLTVNGTGFISSSSVSFNGAAQTANYISGSQLTIALTTAELASVGNLGVVVINPTPGGGSSSAATLTVGNPVPAITSVSPGAASVGSAAETLTVNGTGFVSSSTANFNGTARPTSFVSSTQLTVMISAGDQSAAATDNITISNSGPGGGQSNSVPFAVLAPIAVQVSVVGSDSSGNPLSYRWKATDGNIIDVNSPSTTWTLANGPGLHFAYVLVSNGLGGDTERRIAVNTDIIGTPKVVTAPVTLAAPAAPFQVGDYYRAFVLWGDHSVNTDFHDVDIPDVATYVQDLTSGHRFPGTGTVLTDLKGQAIVPGVPPGTNYALECSVDGGKSFLGCTDAGASYAAEMLPAASSVYINTCTNCFSASPISGGLVLQDGNPCGTVNEYFGVQVTASATLLDTLGQILAGPVRVNEFGDYSLPYNVKGVSVQLRCENAVPVNVPFSNPNLNVPVDLGQAILTAVSAPTVSSMSATFNRASVGTFLPPPSGLPSDALIRADGYLAGKGVDSRLGACQYYKAVGAVTGCDTIGNQSGAISFEDWKQTVKIDKYAAPSVPEYTAAYVNKMDLNLTRVHHSISYGQNQTAAYVCNHLGPPFSLVTAQGDIDIAIDNAVNGKNLVACVAMDYTVTPGVNGGQPFTRFLIFGPGGQLLPSVNLDGRREKFVPGTCVVCHGGDHYAGKFPEDGSGFANVGGHFLPYDTGNFEFSSKAGLTEPDQEQAIYFLNQNVLNAGPTAAERELIAGWYANGHTLDKNYVPPSWQGQVAAAISFYQNVQARTCRSCHVAMVEGYNFDHYQNIAPNTHSNRFADTGFDVGINVCGGSQHVVRDHMMPNSLVTFNRFWLTYQNAASLPDQPTILAQFYGTDTAAHGACTPGITP
jgi:hypothetical protein